MSVAQHTPGPWSVEIEEHTSPYERFVAAISNESLRTLARVPHGVPGWDAAVQAQAIADARLLAAAPELLAACEAQQRVNEHGRRCSRCTAIFDDGCTEYMPLWDEAERLIVAAIAKATGGAQ